MPDSPAPPPANPASVRRYLHIALQNRKLLAIGISTGAIAGLCSGFGVPFFIDRVFRQIFDAAPGSHSFWYLLGIASLLPLIFLLRGISGYINQYTLQWVSQNILRDIRRQLFAKTQSLPIAWFEQRQSGDLMAKMVGDTLQIQHATHLIAKDGFVQPFTFLAGLGFLVFLSLQQQEISFLLLLVILTPALIATVRLIGRKLKKRSRELQATLGNLSDVMAENLRGVTEVRAFNLQVPERQRFESQLTNYNRFAMKMAKYEHLTQPLMEFIAVAMVSVAFLVSYYNQIGFSTFASMGAALFFTADAAKRIVRIFTGYQRTQGSFERVNSILDEPDAIADPPNPLPFPRPRGAIDFEAVAFAYEAGQTALSVPNLRIEAGSVVALVGPSGAGKSTFARLIPRFYDPTSGTIRIDGIDIRAVRQADLRQFIAFVPQDPVLFNASVADNVRMGDPSADDDAVAAAARRAFADEFIRQLPNGYDTIVGENAVRLSGGQRQRLALARAFLRNAPILILDEATSALDTDSEAHIQSALAAFAKDRTVLIIAHRFATIRLASTILLFDNGLIRAQGDLATVMQDPLFQSLHAHQSL